MTLYPGVEYNREVTKEEYLTLASLDCRPQMNTGVYHPMAHLVVRVNNCEHVLCFLEKGLVHQQSLDFVFQEGDNLMLAVEGTGIVHITGYSVSHSMYKDIQDDRSVTSSVRAVPDGIDNDMEPPTLSFMGLPNTIGENHTTAESRLQEGLSHQPSVKVETGEKSDQNTENQTLCQDLDCEIIGVTFAYKTSEKVGSAFQKAAEKINQLQRANKTVVDLENRISQETLPQITNIRTQSFCTEDWGSEMEGRCVESELETNGEDADHPGEEDVMTGEYQTKNSMDVSGEDTRSISHGDLHSVYCGEERLSETTECLESQIQCSSNKGVGISSDISLSLDELPASLNSNLTNNAESRSHEELFLPPTVKVETGEKSDQSTGDQTHYEDVDCEIVGPTCVFEGREGVESLSQKSSQLQAANETNADFGNHNSQETLSQIKKLRTQSFCTEDWGVEMDGICVESVLGTIGEATEHPGNADVNKRAHQSNHSMKMGENNTESISRDEMCDIHSGEERLPDGIHSSSHESQIQCFSNRMRNSSSDITVSCDKNPVSRKLRHQNSAGTKDTELDRHTFYGVLQQSATKNREGEISDFVPVGDSDPEQIPSTSTASSIQRRTSKSGGGKTTRHAKPSKTHKEGNSKSKAIGCDRTPIYRKHYICPVCEMTFRRKVSFLHHRKTHKGSKAHRCHSCKRLFRRNATLCNRKKTGDNLIRCQFCENTFVSKSEKEIRQRRCSSAKVLRCQLCQKKFSSKRSLKIHKNIHTGNSLVQCQFCGKLFTKNVYLIVHERIHTNDKPFQCRFCKRRFTQKGNMIFHEKFHTGEKPFKCQFCEKRFVRKGSVAPHERIHTGERPFKCRFCKKDFVQKIHLIEHERYHTGEKPFKCQFCGKTFVRKGEAACHERSHTGEKPYKCEICGKGFRRQKDLMQHNSNHLSLH